MLKKLWSDPVWSKVIATGICAALAIYIGGWTATLWQALLASWNYLMTSMTLPRWIVGVMGVWSVTTLVVAGIALLRPEKRTEWLTYREDMLFHLRWRWKLTSNANPYDVSVFCPLCDLQLVPSWDEYALTPSTSFQCRCGCAGPWRFSESWPSLEQHVKMTVQQKIRNNTWKQDS